MGWFQDTFKGSRSVAFKRSSGNIGASLLGIGCWGAVYPDLVLGDPIKQSPDHSFSLTSGSMKPECWTPKLQKLHLKGLPRPQPDRNPVKKTLMVPASDVHPVPTLDSRISSPVGISRVAKRSSSDSPCSRHRVWLLGWFGAEGIGFVQGQGLMGLS